MACKIQYVPLNSIAKAVKKPLKERFTFANIPRNTLVIYPLELEDYYELDILDIITVMTDYAYTGIPDPVGILPRNVTSTEMFEYTNDEYFVKYWVNSDNMVIRLTDDYFWRIIQMPSGDLTILIEETPNVLRASTFTRHYLLEIIE